MSLLHIDLAKEVGKAIEQVLKPHLEHFDGLHKIRQLLEELVAIEQRREAAAMELPPPSAVQRRGRKAPVNGSEKFCTNCHCRELQWCWELW